MRTFFLRLQSRKIMKKIQKFSIVNHIENNEDFARQYTKLRLLFIFFTNSIGFVIFFK